MASSSANVSAPVPFPAPEDIQPAAQSPTSGASPQSPTSPQKRSRTPTNASIASTASRLRTASIKAMEASPPLGMWAATGSVTSKAPTLGEIRRGSFSQSGWNEEVQREHAAEKQATAGEEGGRRWMLRRASSSQSGGVGGTEDGSRPQGRRTNTTGAGGSEAFSAVTEEETNAAPTSEAQPAEGIFHTPKYDEKDTRAPVDPKQSSEDSEKTAVAPAPIRPRNKGRVYSNGYVPPPKVPWKTSAVIGLKAFWKFFITPSGFLITIYGLNVVAWGGMLFLLLCNASPAMCHPTCNDIQSPRRIWIEIDSQILNALFCVTGFGLAPWRIRDVYWWAWWRLGGHKRKETGIRRLAGIHRGWFRLPGSDELSPLIDASTASQEDSAVPIPADKIPDAPPTGIRGPPTKGWKMDFVVWMNMWNTFFQIVLCFYMWHYNRYVRPSWATGLFVALGCIVAGLGGIMMFHEGKYLKKVEGVPPEKRHDHQIAHLEDVEAQNAPSETKK